jgi:hypothetical protein
MVAECLRRLAINSGIAVEVGAHDGLTYSNTAALWRDRGWRAVLIEPDPARFRLLVEHVHGHDCIALPRAVGTSSPNRLGDILQAVGASPHIDLLSIDVDGDDLNIVRSLGSVRARVLVCEYNPTIPFDLHLEGAAGTSTGCSLGALVDVAEALGYRLVGLTGTNAVFVNASDAGAFADLETSVDALADRSNYTYVVTDYRGRAAVVGPLPYRYRPGHPRLVPPVGRGDVRLRWSARGASRELAWKATTVIRHARALRIRDAAVLARARLLRRNPW